MSDPSARARAGYLAAFGAEPSSLAVAPGRVNLIGEHTDYNDGFVLPCAIEHHTSIAYTPRADGQVRVVASDLGDARVEFTLSEAIERDGSAPWSDYVRGVGQVLLQEGHGLSGADMVIAGNVPQGAGLSSSASLEVAVGAALLSSSDRAIDPVALAKVGQRAENEYVGCACGIMDQLISALGHPHHALLIDCASLETRAVSMPRDLSIVICDSRVPRGLVDSEYNLRRQQCERAAAHFGATTLREVSLERFEAESAGLERVLRARARHVLTENARTLAAVDALESGQLEALGRLMAGSHRSLRDDFEVTVPPIDALVEIIGSVIAGEGGVRMTGGGFGGCVVALVPRDAVNEVRDAVTKHYPERSGREAVTFVTRASAGVRVEPLEA
ncbi:MAG: galactokinase [Deltaproteobacteria bacterium]|nr:galactokinase [Deltaproteobacteria bacterium]